MGQGSNQTGIQNRIHKSTPKERSYEDYTNSKSSRPTSSVRKRNCWPARKGRRLHLSTRETEESLPVLVFSHPEEARHMEANLKSKTSQQTLHPPEAVPYGNTSDHSSHFNEGLLGDNDRSQRRLLAYSDIQGPSEVPGFSVQTGGLLFQGSPFRTLNGSEGVHSGHQSCTCLSQEQTDNSLRLSRRLATGGEVTRGELEGDRLHGLSPGEFGLGNQPREVILDTVSAHSLPGRLHRFRLGESSSNSREDYFTDRSSSFYPQTPFGESQDLVTDFRSHGQSSRRSPSLPSVYETNPVAPPSSLFSFSGPAIETGSCSRGGYTAPAVVDEPAQSSGRHSLSPRDATDNHHDGCLPVGMGGGLEFRDSIGSLDHPSSSAHQPARDGRGLPSRSPLGPSAQRTSSDNSMRQLDRGVLHKSARGNQVAVSVPENVGPSAPMPRAGCFSSCLSPGGSGECYGGCFVQGDSTGNGVGAFSGLGRARVLHLREAHGRPFCRRGQHQTPNVLLPVLSPSSMDDGCSGYSLGRPSGVCLPSVVSPGSSLAQTQTVTSGPSVNRSLLAEPSVVSSAVGNADRPSVPFSSQTQPTIPEGRENLASASGTPPSLCLAIVNKRFQDQGLPSETADVAAGARRHSTTAIYDSRLQRFSTWAENNGVSPMDASVDQLAEFFMVLYREGKQVSTIRNYRSAIAAVHNGFPDGSTLGSNNTIRQLLKGMFNRRPPQKRLAPSWSINDVLKVLAAPPFEPMYNAPLEQLTFKTVFLVAAASARRRSELHALSSGKGFIRFDPNGVYLLPNPSFLAKNQSPSFTPEAIFLPSISTTSSIREDRIVCPVRALKWYLSRTKPVRQSERLFLIPRQPYGPASKDTLSRWIVQLILPHSQPNERVRAHDLRAHASSRAWFSGVSMEDILKAAAWKTPSTFVASYLTNVVSTEDAFARAVLGLRDRRDPGHRSTQC